MSEMTFTHEICSGLKMLGADVFAIVGGKMQASGYPDRLVTHRDWMGMLEFKGATTPIRLAQKIRMEGINRKRPGTCWVVREPGILCLPCGTEVAKFRNAEELLCLLRSCD